MIRIMLAVALLVPTFALATRPSATVACGIGPIDLASIARGADFIAIVDVFEAGGAHNSLPTLAPDPTFTSSPTYTPTTPVPTLRPFESTPTPVSTYPRATHTPIDLTGIGARAHIVQSIVGQPGSDIDLDADSRREVEARAREVEALDPMLTAPCEVTIGVAHFSPSRRYLIFATGGGARVQWNPVIAGLASTPHLDGQYAFLLPRTIFDKYFPPSLPENYTDDGRGVLIARENLPLATLLAVIGDLRGRPTTITPPNTGTAGLRDPTR